MTNNSYPRVMDKILICILLTASLIKVSENCLQGWVKDATSEDCIMLVESPATWNDAKQICSKLDMKATLSIINTYNEPKRIFDLVSKGTQVQFAWLGANYTDKEWHWIDGSLLFPGNFDWIESPGEYGGVSQSTKERWDGKTMCLQIGQLDNKIVFNDASCDSKGPFICRMKDYSTTPANGAPPTFPESHAADIVLPCVIILLFILLIVGIAVFFSRRKGHIATRPVDLNTYEDLRHQVPNNEHNYSSRQVNGNSDYESQTPHPDVNNRIYSVMDHDYSSAFFPSYIEKSEPNDAYPLYTM